MPRRRPATRAGRLSPYVAALAVALGPAATVHALEIQPLPDLRLRWDNTVRYTTALRVGGPSAALLANVNGDDGDRNFAPGFISHRFDVLSELDLTYRENVGFRLSGAGWFDVLYNIENDNDSPQTANPISVPFDRFTEATRDLHGRRLDLLDALVFASATVAGVQGTLRAGRHTLLWGESLLMADNGISYSQAPLDAIKALSVPGSQAKELFLPVGQVSLLLQPTALLTLAGYVQLEYRRTRLPASGSYFSATDVLDAGGERLFAGDGALFRGRDLSASDLGQWGVSVRYRIERLDADLGLYFLIFHDKVPQLYLLPDVAPDPALGKTGEYALVFPTGIELLGASFATGIGSLSLAGEIHARHDMPLVSRPQTVVPGRRADNGDSPLYARGTTLHGQIAGVYSFGPSALWRSAVLLAEAGWQSYLTISDNPQAFDPNRRQHAVGAQAVFSPSYFQVAPNLDLSVPTSLTYNPAGRGPIAGFNGGAHNGGVASIGVTGEYRRVWLFTIRATYYFGRRDFQLRRDRHFLSFAAQRTF